MLFLIFSLVSSLKITEIPTSGEYQIKRTRVSSVYDAISSQIFTFGGFDPETQQSALCLTSFNLTDYQWATIRPQSRLTLPRLTFSRLFLRNDRKILIFFGSLDSGPTNSIYSYNILTDYWGEETLEGDFIQGMSRYGFTSYIFNNAHFVACFGGLRKAQVSSDLFLINTNTLVSRKINPVGSIPDIKIAPSLVYYKQKIYLFGGSWPLNNDNSNLEVYEFSLVTETWSIVLCNSVKPLARNFHYSYLYNDSVYLLYGSYGEVLFDEIWRFDFVNLSWSLVQKKQGNFRIFAGDVQINNQVYLLFGEDINKKVLNSIDLYELRSEGVRFSRLVDDWISPTARKSHCSKTISNKIYIFGGISEAGEALNDMWNYNIDNGKWASIRAKGDVPGPRYSFACIKTLGTGIIIFGGTDAVNTNNDIYFLDGIDNHWSKIDFSLSTSLANPRFNSCTCYLDFYLFIFGGQDYQGGYSDFWLYNYLTEQTYLISNNLLKVDLINHNCWGEIIDSTYILYIAGGTTYERHPNNKVYKVIVQDKTFHYTVTEIFESNYLKVSYSAFISTYNVVYMLFGILSNNLISTNIVAYNFRKNRISIQEVPSKYVSFASSAIQYGKSFYVFGGGFTSSSFVIYSSARSLFFKMTPDEILNDIECSPGTHGKDCNPCLQGYYESRQVCVPCPPGKYSETIAADNLIFCLPCKYNSYSSSPGSTRCLDCPSNMFCPIASTIPKSGLNNLKYQTNQPTQYIGNSNLISTTINQVSVLLIILAVIITIFVSSSKHFWQRLPRLDMFTDKHDQQLNVPVEYRKTSIGGLFTIFLVLSATIVFIASVLTFLLDNIIENRSLVPLSTLAKTVKAEFLVLEITVFLYSGLCVENGECYSYITVTEVGLLYDAKKFECDFIEENCILRVEYSGVNILSDSQIYIQFLDVFAFASAMSVNMSVSSSIPNEISNVVVPIVSPSVLEVFRGIIPTVLTFEFTPTVFNN